jgi:hypothetical protein
MHVRVTRVTRNGRTYCYAQLVESYRRPEDGVPTHRLVAHLGALPQQEIDNLRAALTASRQGRSVVLPAEAITRPVAQPVLANLSYLDVAVALAMWRDWQLDELLTAVMPLTAQDVSPASVVAALTVQRCVDPGSKLYAQRWFPRTALPELLGVAPGQFNNTRLHRVLDALDQATPELQARLPQRYAARQGAFAALFLDVTDTWFVGRGPDLAEKGKTKEGLYERKVGIVLMCNERGLPLRWEVIPGRQHDSQAMFGVIESVRDLDWLGQAPVVCDRAMGKTAHVQKLLQTGLRFLTALTEEEFEAYTDRIPDAAGAAVALYAEDAAMQAAQAVTQAGMSRLADDLYVLDLGVVARREDAEPATTMEEPPAGTEAADPVRKVLEQVLAMHEALNAGRAADLRAAGRAYGLKKERVAKLMRLLRLAPDLQQEILAGRAARMSINATLRIASLADQQAQREAFDRDLLAAQQSPTNSRQRRLARPARQSRQPDDEPVRLRAVVCFNPEQFLEQRRRADETLAKLRAFVRDLNDQLASPRSRRSKESAYALVHRELGHHDLLNAFEILVQQRQQDGNARLSVELRLQPNVWQKRRRYDGFSVLVAHPDTLLGAAELARLYRAKDAVEQDFHVIKSVIHLRPVRHRTDPKVRAHVTLCMLALLLARTLEHKLAASPARAMTAAMVFETLHSVHLNQMAAADTPYYTVTRANHDQLSILQALGLENFVSDEEVAARIVSR